MTSMKRNGILFVPRHNRPKASVKDNQGGVTGQNQDDIQGNIKHYNNEHTLPHSLQIRTRSHASQDTVPASNLGSDKLLIHPPTSSNTRREADEGGQHQNSRHFTDDGHDGGKDYDVDEQEPTKYKDTSSLVTRLRRHGLNTESASSSLDDILTEAATFPFQDIMLLKRAETKEDQSMEDESTLLESKAWVDKIESDSLDSKFEFTCQFVLPTTGGNSIVLEKYRNLVDDLDTDDDLSRLTMETLETYLHSHGFSDPAAAEPKYATEYDGDDVSSVPNPIDVVCTDAYRNCGWRTAETLTDSVWKFSSLVWDLVHEEAKVAVHPSCLSEEDHPPIPQKLELDSSESSVATKSLGMESVEGQQQCVTPMPPAPIRPEDVLMALSSFWMFPIGRAASYEG